MVNESDKTISYSEYESIIKALQIIEESKVKKKIDRPNIESKKLLYDIGLSGSFLLITIVTFFYLYNKTKKRIFFLIEGLVIGIFNFFHLKKFFISLILLYQKYAPERIRNACVFEPSCSQYMLISIKKYGVFRGIIKGTKRLLRCHYPNGGIDNP